MKDLATVSGPGPKVEALDGGGAAPLRLNFRSATLKSILRYLHEATGLPIQVESNVDIERAMSLWSDELLDKRSALELLGRALEADGYAAIQKRGMLAIIRRQDAKKHYIPLPSLPRVVAERV